MAAGPPSRGSGCRASTGRVDRRGSARVFFGAKTLAAGVDAAVRFVDRHQQALAHLYWGDIDKAGYEAGCDSIAWVTALEEADAELRRLAERLPAGTSLHVTADHGWSTFPSPTGIDLARDRELDAGIVATGASPGHCTSTAPLVPGLMSPRPGPPAWRPRARAGSEAAIAEGWFGMTAERTAPGSAMWVVALDAGLAVEDSRTSSRSFRFGLHGSMTADEVEVPPHLPAR